MSSFFVTCPCPCSRVLTAWYYANAQEQMDLAYQDFKQFLRASSIPCSQPAFTVKLALRIENSVVRHGFVHSVAGCCRSWCLPLFNFCACKVVKKNGEVLMTGKAYNNRCIQLWLEKVMRSAAGDYLHADERIGNMSVCMLFDRNTQFLSVVSLLHFVPLHGSSKDGSGKIYALD